MNILLTGASSGIGKALTLYYLSNGHKVYGISRQKPIITHNNFYPIQLDLSKYELYENILESILKVNELDLVILNAGSLGKLSPIKNTKLGHIKQIMDVNVWSQKEIIDLLISHCLPVKQIISITSGVSLEVNKGWGGYFLSKSMLNSLIQLYSIENENIHFSLLAPGLVDTPMLHEVMKYKAQTIPSLTYIEQQKAQGLVISLNDFSSLFNKFAQKSLQCPSGLLHDLYDYL